MQASATIAPGQQHMRALRRANEVRLARADLKRRVAEGEVSAADVILAPPEEADGMPVCDLLQSQHRWGGTRCRKFLSNVQVSENRTLGALTDRQRRALAEMLGEETARCESRRLTAVAC